MSGQTVSGQNMSALNIPGWYSWLGIPGPEFRAPVLHHPRDTGANDEVTAGNRPSLRVKQANQQAPGRGPPRNRAAA
jgi:hypothetical protein